MEKLEFLYISPYYLQAAFFLLGTFCWLLSETVFKARLPFWTSLWGWSLVLTNFFALPLVNAVGLFLEEAEEKDYLGLLSFIFLSYLLVPFQAYASVKGFIESKEGPWFRTPKTGKITDILTRGKFYRWITGILPGRRPAPVPAYTLVPSYLNLTSANNRFNSFNIKPKRARFMGNLVLIMVLVFSFSLSYFGTRIKTGSLADLPIQTRAERPEKESSFLSWVFKVFSPKEVLAATGKAQGMVVSGVKKVPTEMLTALLLLLLFITITFLIHLYKKKRKFFKKAIKSIFIFFLVFSWLLAGWPSIWQNPRFPQKIKVAQAAEVTIDATARTTLGSLRLNPHAVFISDQVGYVFYVDSTTQCVYSKTTNGGGSWGAAQTVDAMTTCVLVTVWYDRWTPGDTGTIIHIAFVDNNSDDFYYDTLDTNGDSGGTAISVIQPASALTVADITSITKATDGTLYLAGLDGASTPYVSKCSSTCGTALNWSAISTYSIDTVDDPMRLMPLAGGNIMVIRDDISAEDIQSKVWNGSSWDGSWVDIDTGAADHATYQDTIVATLNRATNDIYLAYGADVGLSTADIRTAIYSGGSWTSKTDVITNSNTLTNLDIAYAENTGVVYVAYLRGTLTTSMNAYYNTSSNGMTSWGSETQYNTTDTDLRQTYLNMVSNDRIYGVYEQNATNDGLFGNTIADLTPSAFTQSAYRWFQNNNSTSVGSPIVNQDTAMTSDQTPAQGTAFRLRILIHIGTTNLAISGDKFKLQIATKVGADCDLNMGTTDEVYSNLVTTTGAVRYYDNSTPADNATLTADATNDPGHSGHTKVTQTYKDLDGSDSNIHLTNSVGAISSGQDGEWDFTIVDNSASASTTYCLRIIKSDSSVLDTYSFVPEFTTVPENSLLLFGLYPMLVGLLRKLRRRKSSFAKATEDK